MVVRKDFGLTYRDKGNSNKTPLCIHRAPLGTHERFIGGSQSPASSRRRLRLVIGGRDMESGAVSVRLHHGGPQGAKPMGNILTKMKDRKA